MIEQEDAPALQSTGILWVFSVRFECLQSHNEFIDGPRPGPGQQIVLGK